MTILVAARDTEGTMWYGGDRQATCGHTRVRSGASKWVAFGKNVVVGCAGNVFVQNQMALIAEKNLNGYATKLRIDTLGQAVKFINNTRLSLGDEEYNLIRPKEGDESGYEFDANFLIVSKTNMFMVVSDFSCVQGSDFLAVGSGETFAYGAWSYNQLEPTPDNMETILTRCLEAAYNYDIYCGKEIEVVRFA